MLYYYYYYYYYKQKQERLMQRNAITLQVLLQSSIKQ